MTNDELRALADCLNDPNAMQRTARRKAADYLRAQADAQPVATLTLLDDMGIQIDFRKSFTLLPGQTFFLYTHPAPAAPQAEPEREPLTALRILEIEDDANRKWRDNGRIIEYAVVFARMIESAHGIGGSDE